METYVMERMMKMMSGRICDLSDEIERSINLGEARQTKEFLDIMLGECTRLDSLLKQWDGSKIKQG